MKQTIKQPVTPQKTGEFGPIYEQFKSQPQKAIKHLKKVRDGECVNALYREEIGYIDIVWGMNDPKTNDGYGLKHIIEKHGGELRQLGFEVEDFIPLVVEHGTFDTQRSTAKKIIMSNKTFRVVILKKWNGKQKTFLLTTFDLRKKA